MTLQNTQSASTTMKSCFVIKQDFGDEKM